jgi:hypothetical protein
VAVRGIRRAVTVTAGVVVVAAMAAQPSARGAPLTSVEATATATTSCFGAAARDPLHPCVNPTPAVFPPLEDIDKDVVGGSPCDMVNENPQPLCAFGVPEAQARRHFVLVGDSHALAWRRSIDVVALAERWRGYSISTAGCPFFAAIDRLDEGIRPLCRPWYRLAVAWFRDHPEVSTLFTSSFAPMPVALRRGETYFAVKAAAYRRTWRALPKTVKHIVAIRDVPLPAGTVNDCIQGAIAAGTPAGTACAFPRRGALRWDTAVSTAQRLRSPRYGSIDMTEYFCDRERCYPVVGGVRVYKDPFGHITTAYGRTLGPFMLRKVRRLMATW